MAARLPDNVGFRTRPPTARDPGSAARAAGLDGEVVLASAGYGNDTDCRDGMTEIGLAYVVGIQFSTGLWSSGVHLLPPKQWSGRGHPTSAVGRDTEHHPMSARQPAVSLPKSLAAGHLAGGGAAFIMTPRYASPPTESWSSKGKQFLLGTTWALPIKERRLSDGYQPRRPPDPTWTSRDELHDICSCRQRLHTPAPPVLPKAVARRRQPRPARHAHETNQRAGHA